MTRQCHSGKRPWQKATLIDSALSVTKRTGKKKIYIYFNLAWSLADTTMGKPPRGPRHSRQGDAPVEARGTHEWDNQVSSPGELPGHADRVGRTVELPGSRLCLPKARGAYGRGNRVSSPGDLPGHRDRASFGSSKSGCRAMTGLVTRVGYPVSVVAWPGRAGFSVHVKGDHISVSTGPAKTGYK